MKCPVCKSKVMHTHDVKLDNSIDVDINAKYRYKICENRHPSIPTVELIGRRKTKDGETIAIELSTQYRHLIRFVD